MKYLLFIAFSECEIPYFSCPIEVSDFYFLKTYSP